MATITPDTPVAAVFAPETMSRQRAAGMPWDTDPTACLDAIESQIPFNAIAVGLMHDQQPKSDELLITRGWPDVQLARWCSTDAAKNPQLRIARKRGQCVDSAPHQRGDILTSLHPYLMVQKHPESVGLNRSWCMLIARDRSAFDAQEQQAAGMMLRQWQTRFNSVVQPGEARLLIGHDGRLINADPWIHARLLDDPEIVEQLLEFMRPVVAQRWEDSNGPVQGDFSVQIGKQDYWVCFNRRSAVDAPDSEHWLIELRPLGKDELPVVGVVQDRRIAKAIAFIHDNYDHSPNLTQIARSVHISPFHFQRVFTKQVGMSPKHYLQRKQLQMARWLLRASRSSIGTIATRCGFASHGHFTSTFRRYVGMSPSQFRERD